MNMLTGKKIILSFEEIAMFLVRLKDELKVLRKIYEEHMRVSQETLEMTYKQKVIKIKERLSQ